MHTLQGVLFAAWYCPVEMWSCLACLVCVERQLQLRELADTTLYTAPLRA